MRIFSFAFLAFICAACAVADSSRLAPMVTTSDGERICSPVGTAYTRTTIYFGLTRPMGSISEAEWQNFLRDEVTPRFPDGLTVLEADGQYRRADGSIQRERSKVLVILHDEKPATREALGDLVVSYKKNFAQESVLWETARVCAAF